MFDSVIDPLRQVKDDFMTFFNDRTIESFRMFPKLENNSTPNINNEFIAEIEENGLSLETLEGLKDKFYKLYDLVYPFLNNDSDCPIITLSITYINCLSPLIIGANDDLEHELSLYNGVYTSNDPLIKKEFLVKLGDLKVGNFYKTIPPI